MRLAAARKLLCRSLAPSKEQRETYGARNPFGWVGEGAKVLRESAESEKLRFGLIHLMGEGPGRHNYNIMFKRVSVFETPLLSVV